MSRILVLEDEIPTGNRLVEYLHRFDDSFEIDGPLRSVAEARKYLRTQRPPDLIISDIKLLDGNVLGLYESYLGASPIIFATAYDEFLLQAFNTNGIGYLLKPYDYEQFSEALAKWQRIQRQPAEQPTKLNSSTLAALESALAVRKQNYRSRFTSKKRSGVKLLQVEEILFVESEDKVNFAVDATGERHALNQSLNELERQLDPQFWTRANRATLVNIRFVERFEPYGRDRIALHLTGVNDPIIVSTSRTPVLRQWLADEL